MHKVKIKMLISIVLFILINQTTFAQSALSDSEKTITLRATFSDPNATLEGDFLTNSRQKLVTLLGEAGYPLKA